jgi:hypothetical protein
MLRSRGSISGDTTTPKTNWFIPRTMNASVTKSRERTPVYAYRK